jgi:cell division protein FtsW
MIYDYNNKKYIFFIVCLVMLLSILGCVFVYSASMYNAKINYGNEYHFLIKQIIGVVIGSIAMIIISFIDYHIYKKYKWFFVAISFILLLLVFIPNIGKGNYGSNRWINLGFFTIQASEIAKFGFVIFSSAYLSDKEKEITSFKTLIPILLVGGSMCLLILLEPNMSITICLGLTMLCMLFIGGIKIKHFLLLMIPLFVLVPLLILIEPYRVLRLLAFLDPWNSPKEEGFQLVQSLYSIGSGGLFGVGLFNSRQKYLFLPFSESDFIFSIIAEESGFFGSLLLILTYIILILLLFKVVKYVNDKLGFYLIFGIATLISIQVLINLAVVSGLIPPTGVPLPFISAGSSSIIVFMSSIGIVINVLKSKKLDYEKIEYKSLFKKIKLNKKMFSFKN